MSVRFFFFLVILVFAESLSAQIINIEDRRQRRADSTNWQGFVDVSLHANRNTRRVLQGRLNTQVQYHYKKHFAMWLLGGQLLRVDGRSFANDGFSHVRYNYDMSDHVVFEAYGQIQYNEQLFIRLRSLVGSGLRFKYKVSPTVRFYSGIGLMPENNLLTTFINYQRLRMSNYVSMSIKPDPRFAFVSTHYWQPDLERLRSNHRYASESTLLIKLTDRLVFRQSLSLVYDNDPVIPPTVPRFVLATSGAIRLEF
jgi:hypothetical protein